MGEGGRAARRRAWLIAVGVIGLAVFGLVAEGSHRFDPARRVLRSQAVPSSAFGSQKLLKSLNRLGVIHPDFRRAALPQAETADQPGSRYLYGARRLRPEEMPSSTIVPDSWRRRGGALLSLALSPNYHAGLLGNANRRGRRWERFAYASYFEDGELRFASGAGLRIHGGLSRLTSPTKSYRLYFREELGQGSVPRGSILDPSVPRLHRLVVHNDVRTDEYGEDWHFIRPLGYDIARRIGAPAPRTKPAWLLINGKPLGVYVLTEYLDENYLRTRFGHDRFVLFRERKNPWDERLELGPEEIYQSFRGWVDNLPRRLTLEAAEERIDVDNLSRWLLTVLFCGATDSLQGPALLDLTEAEPRWRWITWDLDHGFKTEWAEKPGEELWEIDVFPSVVVYAGREFRSQPSAPRSDILQALLRGARYRRYLADLFDDVMNHELTQDFLAERYDHYVALAADLGLDNPAFERELATYFEKRPEALRRQLERYLEIGESHLVEVTAAEGCAVRVDGRLEAGDYRGTYFDGGELRLAVERGCASRFAGWQIDGARVEQPSRVQQRIEVRGNLKIQPLLRPAAGS